MHQKVKRPEQRYLRAVMKFLIIDDHAVVRDGIAAVVRQVAPDATILQAPTSDAALGIARGQPDIDLVLLDLILPDASNLSALEAFSDRHPQMPVVILSSSENPEDVRQALALGAVGYVAKSAASATLVAALRLVLAGEIYVPAFMAQVDVAPMAPIAGLTARQVDVLRLVSAGVGNKEIAHRLMISEKTVKAHLTTIFRALGVSDRQQAAKAFRSRGEC